jgi:hypothetical protein
MDTDQLLDRIVVALREEPIPPFVGRPAERPFGGPMVRQRRALPRWVTVGGALATVAVSIVAVMLIIPAAHTSVAFADVQEAVAAFKSLRYRILDFHGDKDPYVTTVAWARGKGSRAEGSNGSETITNLKAERMLWLDHQKRKARLYQIYLEDANDLADRFDEKIRNLPRDAKPLGTTELNGKKVLQFAFANLGEFIVFADPQTKFPLRMELKADKGLPSGASFREVVTDFVFDAPINESFFEINIPQGYAVERCEEPAGRKPIDTRTLVVSPTKGVGKLPMNASKDEVIAFFGTPDLIETQHLPSRISPTPVKEPAKGESQVLLDRLNYNSLGFEVTVLGAKGTTEFRCLSGGLTTREFLGKTDAGIGMGATIDEVLKAYGSPEVKTHLRDDCLYYFHKGWSFVFGDGKLISFSATEPLSDEIEIQDRGDGSWTERVKGK